MRKPGRKVKVLMGRHILDTNEGKITVIGCHRYLTFSGVECMGTTTIRIMRFSITTLSIMTLSIDGLFVTFSIKHKKNYVIMLKAIILTVAFYLVLC